MAELKKHIYDENNGLYYTLVGDYYIPNLKLSGDENSMNDLLFCVWSFAMLTAEGIPLIVPLLKTK